MIVDYPENTVEKKLQDLINESKKIQQELNKTLNSMEIYLREHSQQLQGGYVNEDYIPKQKEFDQYDEDQLQDEASAPQTLKKTGAFLGGELEQDQIEDQLATAQKNIQQIQQLQSQLQQVQLQNKLQFQNKNVVAQPNYFQAEYSTQQNVQRNKQDNFSVSQVQSHSFHSVSQRSVSPINQRNVSPINQRIVTPQKNGPISFSNSQYILQTQPKNLQVQISPNQQRTNNFSTNPNQNSNHQTQISVSPMSKQTFSFASPVNSKIQYDFLNKASRDLSPRPANKGGISILNLVPQEESNKNEQNQQEKTITIVKNVTEIKQESLPQSRISQKQFFNQNQYIYQNQNNQQNPNENNTQNNNIDPFWVQVLTEVETKYQQDPLPLQTSINGCSVSPIRYKANPILVTYSPIVKKEVLVQYDLDEELRKKFDEIIKLQNQGNQGNQSVHSNQSNQNSKIISVNDDQNQGNEDELSNYRLNGEKAHITNRSRQSQN